MKTKYIHYGNTTFEPERFSEIKNRKYFTKPDGGFWASPVDAEYGWKDWTEDEKFTECREDNSFVFTLKDDTNVLHIHSCNGLNKLPGHYEKILGGVYFDFEKMKADGIDAVELHLSDDRGLYWALYGWDCDSILIMNKDVIEMVGD